MSKAYIDVKPHIRTGLIIVFLVALIAAMSLHLAGVIWLLRTFFGLGAITIILLIFGLNAKGEGSAGRWLTLYMVFGALTMLNLIALIIWAISNQL